MCSGGAVGRKDTNYLTEALSSAESDRFFIIYREAEMSRIKIEGGDGGWGGGNKTWLNIGLNAD